MTDNTKTAHRRLIRLEVEDFKKIHAVALDIRQGITEISGANAQGKSSLLDSVAMWLDGLKVKDAPTEPIRNGAQRARIRGRLGDMIVTRTITRKKGGGHDTEIRFEPVSDGKGKPYPATQKQLNDLIGEHNLDPLDFLRLDTRGKFDALKVFVPGFDFEKAARETAGDYARRTEVNRIAGEATAAAGLIIVPDGTPDEPVDEQALVRELQAAGERNTDIERRRANREKAVAEIGRLKEVANGAVAQIEAHMAERNQRRDREIADIEERIAQLQRQIQEARDAAHRECGERAREIGETTAQAQSEADALQAKLDAAGELPKSIDTAALSTRIEAARATNQAVDRAQSRAKHLSTAAKYEAESEALTGQMKAREAAKREAIANAKLPIDGIEFGDGEIRYLGAPFEQASTSQKLKVAVARMVALNPTLRLGWIRDASLLDDDSYAELARLAETHQIDILIETVRSIGKDAIVLVDGRLKDAEEPESATQNAN